MSVSQQFTRAHEELCESREYNLYCKNESVMVVQFLIDLVTYLSCINICQSILLVPSAKFGCHSFSA